LGKAGLRRGGDVSTSAAREHDDSISTSAAREHDDGTSQAEEAEPRRSTRTRRANVRVTEHKLE